MSEKRRCLAVIRVRGASDIFREVEDTLKMLHLPRNYHATLVNDNPSYRGMLRKAQSRVTWGEISLENIILLLKKRGRVVGNRKLTDEHIKEIGYVSLEDLAKTINNGNVEFGKIPKIKPVFRLHPPKKGFKGKVKRSYAAGGVTGYRGEAINDLIERMI